MKNSRLDNEQLSRLNELLAELSPDQQVWLSGFIEGRIGSDSVPTGLLPENETAVESNLNLTILYGTETGNTKELADKLASKAAFKNINAKVVSLYDFNINKVGEEENLAILVSTHGEGDPPDMAEDFHKFITGTRAPELKNLSFAVLALGDKSYKYFCKTGEEIFQALKEKGAHSLTSLVKCDVDYERDADLWMNNLLVNLTPSVETESKDLPQNKVLTSQNLCSKSNPFEATVLDKIKISGSDSDKEVYHIELDLEESGITYEPGDAVGIFPKNPKSIVEKILELTGFNPEKRVDVNAVEVSLKEALLYHLEITVLSFDILQKYYQQTKNTNLEKLLNNDKALDEYFYGRDVLDLLEDFPYQWNANKFIGILRVLPPRLYSISSSQQRVGEELHITVSAVRYELKKRLREGACSVHLADHIEIGKKIAIYIDKNPSFKLPLNGANIIMVGTGTGVAPYRAFMQHRESLGIKGNAWLFFGDRTFNSDFLYQKEWQKLLATKVLDKMDVAFSRDQKDKVYIQHKLKEKKKEVYELLENGAHFYLCGDKKNMAKDVNATLLEIIQEQGGMSPEKAAKYLKNLKREKRFQTDVY